MEYKNCIVFLMGFSGVGKSSIAQEIIKHPHFKLVTNRVINNPVTGLLDLPALKQRVPEAAWQQINKIRDAVFTAIKDISPQYFSFVMTHDMVDGETYPQILFDQTLQLANARQAYFLPVRLKCNEEQLIKRVSSDARKEANVITDTDRAVDMARNKKVFYSNHPNELTLDVSDQSPEQVARLILDVIDKKL